MAIAIDRSVVGTEFDRMTHAAITQADIDAYAAAAEEPCPAGDVAPPTYVVSLRSHRFMPKSLAQLGRAGLDAGKDIEFGAPIRVGDVLTTVSTVHDLYEKTGRSGTMGFIVLRTVVTNQRGESVAVIDQRMMFQ